MSKQIEERYFALVEQSVRNAIVNPGEESNRVAVSALRRYKALMKRDYKTLWEETEALLMELRGEFEVLRGRVEEEKGLVRKVMESLESGNSTE